MAEQTPKNIEYPNSSGDVGRMLNIDPTPEYGSLSQAKAEAPAGLPIDTEMAPPESHTEIISQETEQMGEAIVDVNAAEEELEKKQGISSKFTKDKVVRVLKKIAPYAVVFIIGLGIYQFYASDFSWTSIFKSGSPIVAGVSTKNNVALDALKKQEAVNYNGWINQFFFQADASVKGMDVDVSGNGLTNFQKYLLNLNPKVYGTLGNGTGDGQQVINYINPWTGLGMTDDQKKLVDTYFDKELISNRITAAAANPKNSAFAPFVASGSPYFVEGVSNISNGDAATTPVVTASTQTQTAAPASGADNSFGQGLDIDTSIPGHLDVPNKISAPMIWSTDPAQFESDLSNGVIHYTGTPMPGDIGTSYISGHSSGYFWDHSKYKDIFAHLNDVKDGESFTITVTLKTGKRATLHYVVGGRSQYKADDPRQFVQTSQSVVALSTCWPVNTTARRLVLYATLTQTDK